jgi:hypothetical protein
MENKYFLHRVQKDGDNYTKGIEIHDSLDSAIQAFHSRMKTAYKNPSYPNTSFVSCMVTDSNDDIVSIYNETWSNTEEAVFFVHYIRLDGETFTKGIDVFTDYNDACRAFHTYMEYGYGNSKFPNISFVSTKIIGASGIQHKVERWTKPE